jgi:hypothetical protein
MNFYRKTTFLNFFKSVASDAFLSFGAAKVEILPADEQEILKVFLRLFLNTTFGP